MLQQATDYQTSKIKTKTVVNSLSNCHEGLNEAAMNKESQLTYPKVSFVCRCNV